jgi:uncharacterized membrane protein YhhN
MIGSRAILILALFLGVTHVETWSVHFGDTFRLAWKFACVGMLALYAGWQARSVDGWMLVVVLLLSAASDVLLEAGGQLPGALSFVAANMIAITLYARNLAPTLRGETWAAAALVVAGCVTLAYVLPTDRTGAAGIALFTVPLAAMAAMAWMSQFPRPYSGVGAAMILSSDLMIFARMGPLNGAARINETIWLLYFFGEFLVTIGITCAMGRDPQRGVRSIS